MTFARYLAKRSIILVGTLFATVLITVVLVGAGMDDILKNSIKRGCVDDASKIRFLTPEDHDNSVKNCIETKLKNAGLHP